jgi:hypothetical protein
VVEKPFISEAELEKYIFDNQDILGGDITIIYRQIRTGHKQGIPDMLGVDQDERICLIELKNGTADESILPQALAYAIWAETNPDSVKAIWLESKRKPEDIQIDWDNLDIRIILLAPSFKSTVPRMVRKLGYQVDLIQVRRYIWETEEFLLVEVLEAERLPKAVTTKPKGEWDWDYYASEHGKEATDQFRRVVEAIDRLCKEKGWEVIYNLNKYYTGFKLGNRIVFDVSWGGTYAWKVELKLKPGEGDNLKGNHWEFQRYDDDFHNAVFRPLNPNNSDLTELEPLFEKAYQNIAGIK